MGKTQPASRTNMQGGSHRDNSTTGRTKVKAMLNRERSRGNASRALLIDEVARALDRDVDLWLGEKPAQPSAEMSGSRGDQGRTDQGKQGRANSERVAREMDRKAASEKHDRDMEAYRRKVDPDGDGARGIGGVGR